MTVLIAGSTGTLNSSHMEKDEGLETKFQSNLNPKRNTIEPLSLIPYTENAQLTSSPEAIYTYEFSAEKGDKIHLSVSATRQPYLQILLIPRDGLTDNHVNQSFSDFEERITEASSESTKNLEAHVAIPEDDDYTLVVRHISQSGMASRAAGFEIIIGSGLFSSMVVRTGGYLELFIISSSLVIVLGTGIYVYKRLKKKSTFEEESEEWEKEVRETSEKNKDSRSEKSRSEKEVEDTPDDTEYLRYEE